MLGGVFLLDFLFYFRIVNFSKNICIEALSGAFNFIDNLYMQLISQRKKPEYSRRFKNSIHASANSV